MSSTGYRRSKSFLQAPTLKLSWKQTHRLALSPEIFATSSSGYSTGSSTADHRQEQNKSKSKGFHQLMMKIKNLIFTPKSKGNVMTEDLPIYPLRMSHTVTLPLTSSVDPTSSSPFEKISTWLNENSSVVPSMIRQNSLNYRRTPQRSTSLVSSLTRPVFDRKSSQRSISPASSFSSSILARGMSERITPIQSTPPIQIRSNLYPDKSNRRRTIDFNRRRTVAGSIEPILANKENFSGQRRQNLYRFSPSVSNELPPTVPKKYFFHPNPVTPRALMISQIPRNSPSSSDKSIPRRTTASIQPSESLDDLLCDREVESYFYPTRQMSSIEIAPYVYINLATPTNHYQALPYIQGTLC